LHKVANKQMDNQTNNDKKIIVLAEVMNITVISTTGWLHFLD